MGIGAAAGAAGAAIGMSGASMMAGTSHFATGLISGAMGGAASGFVSSAANNWMAGASFGGGLSAGLLGASIGAAVGSLSGAVAGGIQAMGEGRNFFTNSRVTNLDIGLAKSFMEGLARGGMLFNKSDFTIYFKPEGDLIMRGESYKNHIPYVLPPGRWSDIPFDGISAPHLRYNHVYKVVTGSRAVVTNSGIDVYPEWTPSRLGAHFLRAGWKGQDWLNQLHLHPVHPDHSWDLLFKTSIPK